MKKILILSSNAVDDFAYANSLKKELAKLGHEVTVASHKEGLEKFIDLCPDATIVDECEFAYPQKHWGEAVQCFKDIKAALTGTQKILALGAMPSDNPDHMRMPTTIDGLSKRLEI